MNARLTLTDIAARIRTELNDATIHVGTSYDRDYMTAFTKTYPAVWVAAQRLTPIDTGRGYSGLYRQHARVEFVVNLVVQRYAENQPEVEAALNELHDAVCAALLGWTPTSASEHVVLVSSQDGPPSQTLSTVSIIFAVTTTYQRTAP